jgi:hypothetical protein
LTSDRRYLLNEDKFKEYAYTALGAEFSKREEFEYFYSSLPSDAVKDEFLRVSSFYLFLVRGGDWHVRVKGSDSVVDYLTNTFKLVSIFSLIESMSDEIHTDFFQWLCDRKKREVFPISDREALNRLHDEYKDSFGATKKCIGFFNRLSPDSKRTLCNSVQIDRKPMPSIEKLARFLYDLRSKFVHESTLVLSVSDVPMVSYKKRKKVVVDLSIETLGKAFQEGVKAHFEKLKVKS